jgi:hypothetical protein
MVVAVGGNATMLFFMGRLPSGDQSLYFQQDSSLRFGVSGSSTPQLVLLMGAWLRRLAGGREPR